jgi:hypothetical protein
MRKLIFLSLTFLAPLVSACGADETHVQESIVGFGFAGGIVFTLAVTALVLAMFLMSKKLKYARRKNG